VKVVAPAGAFAGEVAFVQTSTSSDEYMCEVLLPATAEAGQECVAEPWGYMVPPVDVFSCGVCLFIMAGGFPPWLEAKPSDPHFTFVEKHGIAALLQQYGKQMQPATLDLIALMVKANPTQRVTVAECLAHQVFATMQ